MLYVIRRRGGIVIGSERCVIWDMACMERCVLCGTWRVCDMQGDIVVLRRRDCRYSEDLRRRNYRYSEDLRCNSVQIGPVRLLWYCSSWPLVVMTRGLGLSVVI